MKIPPKFAHQETDAAFEMERDAVLDTSDPGTGKTRTRLEVFAKRRSNGAKSLLVLAPKPILKTAWEADCRKFTPWLKTSVAFAENREKAFDAKADVYITNHDAAKWLAKQPDKFFGRFDCLVIDESGAFKHHTSQRSRALNKIKKHFKRRVCMNGVPNPNTITDIWNQVFVLDDGRRLGKSFYAFRSSTQSAKQVGPQANMVKWEDRPGAQDAVAALLKDITIRHSLEDCHDIPANHNYVVQFELGPKARAAYDGLEAAAVLQVKGGLVTAINAAALVTKLLQVASGAVYDEDGEYHLIDTGRYELIGELCEQRKHSVVFFLWKHQRDLITKELDKRGITHTLIDGSVSPKKRDEAVQFFQGGFYRVLLAHPASAAHGLTLTKGTSTIWASPTYNLEHWLQGNRRIHRAGQTQKTETVNILAPETLEEKVHGVLSRKNSGMVELLEVLR